MGGVGGGGGGGGGAGTRAIIKVLGHQYGWLAGRYDLEIGCF